MSSTLADPFTVASARLRRRVSDWLAAWCAGDPAYFATGVLLLSAALPLAAAMLVDDRLFLGSDIWLKPLKFAIALSLYAFTLALFSHALAPSFAARGGYRMFRAVVIVAMWAELLWIAGAAAAGTASHFNTEGLWAVFYPVAGILATILTSASAVLAWGVARNRQPTLPPALRDGLALGLVLVLPLTLVTAGTLSSNGGHFVGLASDAGGLPFLGWSREVGDLRVAHFLATHVMHAVPAFALISIGVLGRRRAPVWAFAGAWAGLVAFTFLQALAGHPFLPMIG